MRRVLTTAALAATATSAIVGFTASASIRTGSPSRAPGGVGTASSESRLASEIEVARLATAKYATNLARARADGYRIITRMIPNMGFHYMNPKVTGFDVRRPPILVYERRGSSWQLGALEWVFTSMPATPPLPGARYGVFGAACHYTDGTVVFANAQALCAAKSPHTGAAFSFWHPRLITLHFWVWYPNPSGLYMGTN